MLTSTALVAVHNYTYLTKPGPTFRKVFLHNHAPTLHIMYCTAGSLSSPTESLSEREFLGNGEWPVGPAASVSPGSISIPSPPVEGVDNATKMVYKMSARPRGIGIYYVCQTIFCT